MNRRCINCNMELDLSKFSCTGKKYRFKRCNKCRYERFKKSYVTYYKKKKIKEDQKKIKIEPKPYIENNDIKDNNELITKIFEILDRHKDVDFNQYFNYEYYLEAETTNENLNNLYNELKFWTSDN